MEKHDPLEDIFVVRERINRLFESAHGRVPCETSISWTPVVDVYETAEQFVVKAELPEVAEEDLSVQVEGDVLRLAGERRLQREGRHYFQVERCYGKFSRSFSLPENVDREAIEAVLKDGILKVRLPKRKREGRLRIEII